MYFDFAWIMAISCSNKGISLVMSQGYHSLVRMILCYAVLTHSAGHTFLVFGFLTKRKEENKARGIG